MQGGRQRCFGCSVSRTAFIFHFHDLVLAAAAAVAAASNVAVWALQGGSAIAIVIAATVVVPPPAVVVVVSVVVFGLVACTKFLNNSLVYFHCGVAHCCCCHCCCSCPAAVGGRQDTHTHTKYTNS